MSDSLPSTSNADFRVTTMRLGDRTLQVRIPMTSATSQQGLGGVTHLGDDEGMLWNFSTPQRPIFWMQGMKIALDFIWIRDGRVTEITADVPPPSVNNQPTFSPSADVTQVLEVRAGFAKQYHISVGTTASFE